MQTHCTCGIYKSPEIDHSVGSSSTYLEDPTTFNSSNSLSFKLGYDECTSEVINFLVQSEGFYVEDSVCVRLTLLLPPLAMEQILLRVPLQTLVAMKEITPTNMHNNDICGHKNSKGEDPHSFPSSLYSIPKTSGVANTKMDANQSLWSSHNMKSTQYKFKSNMHERFSHQRPPHDLSESDTKTGGEKSLFKPYSKIQHSLPPSRMNSFQSNSFQRSKVPIFALHPKDGYYIRPPLH
ncbi:unnamed protein product [Lepeophtheirus salmonis]|uniref:(salmon louse) hypothetical protein n=1 Tax=Lepeophtheirus salmonis TaxID=72036 RepID=A0A7R8H7E8_LEPSM|nr:unnamed protein product [Lepeophtheirus salmonis]CAF2906910.1 unnamed protein product [Lepeophtheirus salmonis]